MVSEFIEYNAGILELTLLKNGIPKKYHDFFKTSFNLLSWLFYDTSHFNNVDPVAFIAKNSHVSLNKVYNPEKILKVDNEVDEDDEDEQYEPDNLDLNTCFKGVVIYTVILDDIKYACKELLEMKNRLENLSNLNVNDYNKFEEAKFNFDMMEKFHDYFENKLNTLDVHTELPETINDLNLLSMDQRWSLYYCWVQETKEMIDPKIMKYEELYAQVYKQYSELRELENIELLNKMHVIAITTTGAAKHRIMLESLESPIGVYYDFFLHK